MTEIMQLMVIDDNEERRRELIVVLEFIGESCIEASSEEWQKTLKDKPSLLGVFVGQTSDADETKSILDNLNNENPSMPLVLVGNKDSDKNEIDSPPASVLDQISWPFNQNQILKAIHWCHFCHHDSYTSDELNKFQELVKNMVGKSDSVVKTRRLIEQVADSDASVLILGESGTGKEIAARNLHNLSDRSDKPFVPVNCGAIPADLLESELFGHEKGAFTGALTTRKGRFELAEGGTLFLDEIGDMPMPMQVKLLRVLQERTFERVGSCKSINSNVRIIAATHRNLEIEVRENRFREDLFYRLNVFPIEIPSLSERVEDIPILVNELVSRLENDRRGSVRLSANALRSLMKCSWPGNIRELNNLMERLCILFPYGVVDIKDLPTEYQNNEGLSAYQKPDFAENNEFNRRHYDLPSKKTVEVETIDDNGIDLKEVVKNIEISYIEQALSEDDWVVARAAKRLSMQRTTLVEKMRKYDLHKNS